ncbi:MaoC/PaaZ C-terminal domain-containing protein [Hephaestia sp. GCM10023244]|uniref:MaoC/PaaZ C-terminal domain-containing protein n=1 Tax=unclassified Hephaestia TaxID=2631281 RepID=UPI0020776C81|nr:MaoC/PaaZ C-terminal domain-containing protein [Hephaestia sp. MAHUQ-44]MCM8731633.1 MaoC family dehydratase N-terminal domain-containing protein [Hephaestia sp. MAHUQ-44]
MLDPHALVARAPIETRQELTCKDTILYALGVGAEEIAFTYEADLKALPTMAVVLTYPGFFWQQPDYGVDWPRILHGEQSVTIHRPLPAEGRFVGRTRFEGVEDKGPDKGAVVLVSRTIEDEDGVLYATDRRTAFLRGDGGCGNAGAAIPRPTPIAIDRAPDWVITLPTTPGLALLYRLSGDTNPLHVDPEVARAAGFARPILHGLCSYAVAGRAVLRAVVDNDPVRLTRLDARFSAPVYPGETIETRLWRDGDTRVRFESHVVDRNVRVLTHGLAEFA